jgi:hypothetical protein
MHWLNKKLLINSSNTESYLWIHSQIYSILCILSQYQDYCAGRGTAEYDYKNPRNNKLKVNPIFKPKDYYFLVKTKIETRIKTFFSE